jgi:hypothetical protein
MEKNSKINENQNKEGTINIIEGITPETNITNKYQ